MYSPLLKGFLDLSRSRKRLVIVFVDLVIIFVSIWVAFSLRFDVLYVPSAAQLWIFLAAPVIGIPVSIRLVFSRAIFLFICF